MNSNSSVVTDDSELPEAIHEEADSGPGGTNKLRESLLRYLGDDCFDLSGLTKLCHEQKYSCETLFTGIEKLIYKICLGSQTPLK